MLSKKSIAVIKTLGENYRNGMYTGIRERQTEIALVNPFLCALGWEPCDLSQVHVQELVQKKPKGLIPDYALFVDDKIKFIIEVKKVGEKLNNPDFVEQIKGYFEAVPTADIAILTDGIKYWFFSYVGFKAPIMNITPFATIDISDLDIDNADSFVFMFEREIFVSRFTKYLSTADYIRERYMKGEKSEKRRERREAKKSFFKDASDLKLTVKGEEKPISRAQVKQLYDFTSNHARSAFSEPECDTHKKK